MIILIVTALIICTGLHFHNPASVSAESGFGKLEEIRKKLKSKLLRVEAARKKEKSLNARIEDINSSIEGKENELKKYDRNISRRRRDIQRLSREIGLLEDKLNDRKEKLKEYVRALHKRQLNSSAVVLVSAGDYQDFIRKSRYISLVAYHNSNVMNEYKDALERLNSKKMEQENLYAGLKVNRESALKMKKELQVERKRKDKLFAMVRSKRIAQEKKIKELEESSRKLRKMMAGLHAKQIPKAIIGEGFRTQKGGLPWPLDGKVLVHFGKNHNAELKITTHKNGIEIDAKSGEKAKAIAGGSVVFADKFDGYGNLLIIDHGNGYHSLYGNLSKISLKVGELMIEGMDVGIIGESRSLHAPALYFEIRHKGRPVNPAEWLTRRSNNLIK